MYFASDFMRMSAGGSGAFLELQGVAYEGHHGLIGPKIGGTHIFCTPAVPGWSKSGTFEDPRYEPFGILPAKVASRLACAPPYRHNAHARIPRHLRHGFARCIISRHPRLRQGILGDPLRQFR
jgi:hypothetical protein